MEVFFRGLYPFDLSGDDCVALVFTAFSASLILKYIMMIVGFVAFCRFPLKVA